ncbi:MAG: chemotaxis protein CheV [Proteobacteria bacterium]|nr:chemotaxis protein CheV [Pseudomonadota bacterium]MBS0553568.1 chemotaxis protein CheV [Pseudomonadota bacterium]
MFNSDLRDSALLDSIDGRTRLVGSNRMELLLFSLGTEECFGINVFKVREVCCTPFITRTPNMPHGMEGLISLRGNVIPVLSLNTVLGLGAGRGLGSTMMVTEYSKHTLGFLVHGVDRIVRVDWDKVHAPDNLAGGTGTSSFITAITQLDDGRLVSILDVETILANTFGDAVVGNIVPVDNGHEVNVFFVDDSTVARRKIVEVLDRLGVRHKHAQNGLEAWNRLEGIASHATLIGRRVADEIDVILVDAEMPEMDGYVLTRNIKGDARFDGVPVVMHSSLSSEANRAMGRHVGVDAYVAKFDADVLAETLRPLLQRAVQA